MKYAIDLPNFGPFADARVLAELAKTAEDAGWDGFFLWDHIHWHAWPHTDPWIALALIALNTQRIRIGTMVTPIPRRRPHKLARETVTIDHLSGGRLILGVGSGGSAGEYDNLGEADTAQKRAAMLDEGLELLTRLWSGATVNYEGQYFKALDATFLPAPVQSPRIPVWVAGFWPNRKPMQRAARYDGVFPLSRSNGPDGLMAVADMRAAIDYVAEQRGSRNFEVAHAGNTPGDPARAGAILRPYADIGVTWWLENADLYWLDGWSPEDRRPADAIRARIEQGPPRI